MGRRPQATPSRRCYITLEAADAELLYAEAKERGKPVATVAAYLLVEQLRATAPATDLSERQRLTSPPAENVFARVRVRGNGARNAAGALPRWEWAIEDILADRGWWTTWLPRLHELLGRQSARYTLGHGEPRDHRGYIDLLAFLFPPVEDESGTVEWHQVDYPRQARRYEQAENRSRPTIDAPAGGRQLGATQTINSVAVTGGLFTVSTATRPRRSRSTNSVMAVMLGLLAG